MSKDEEEGRCRACWGDCGWTRQARAEEELPNEVRVAASAPGRGDSGPWGWSERPGAAEPWDSSSSCHGKGLQAVN